MWLLAIFIAVPLIEIALFIKVGGWLTLWPTLGIVILTAILGTALVRYQGRGVLNDLRGALDEVRDPSEPLAHGAMIVLAGALLVTPGFMTDAFGLALLVPKCREWVFGRVRRHVTIVSAGGPAAGQGRPGAGGYSDGHGDVIEGDYHAQDEVRTDARGSQQSVRKSPSGWTRH